jgi:hypothetical protein
VGREGSLELAGWVGNSFEAAGKRGAHRSGCSTMADAGAKGNAGEGADHESPASIDGTVRCSEDALCPREGLRGQGTTVGGRHHRGHHGGRRRLRSTRLLLPRGGQRLEEGSCSVEDLGAQGAVVWSGRLEAAAFDGGSVGQARSRAVR